MIAIPITLGSACLQIITALASKIYMGQLLASGISQRSADTMRGIHVMTQTIFNMPCAFITPITVSIIPAITAQLTTGDHADARKTEESAARITGLIAIPCAIGLAVLARPITALLGGYTGEKLALATTAHDHAWASASCCNAVVLVTTAIMQAHGNVILPVVNMAACRRYTPAKRLYSRQESKNRHCWCTHQQSDVLCAHLSAESAVLLIIFTTMHRGLLPNVLRPLLSGLLMGACAYGCYQAMLTAHISSRLLLCAVPVSVGAIVYLAAVIFLKVLRKEDCMLLPKGEKIARWLHLEN